MTTRDLFGDIVMTEVELGHKLESAFFTGVVVGCAACLVIGSGFVWLAFG
jgi:hypothetical protein